MPERIQRQRTAGWRMPEGAVYVGRPTRWGNPYIIGQVGDSRRWTGYFVGEERRATASHGEYPTKAQAAARAVMLFELHTGPLGDYELDEDEVRRELGGRDLACWCPLVDEQGDPFPCHADALLRIANSEDL